MSKVKRPSHAVVVAYLALFVALGGSGYAAITVSGKNVKNRSLTGKDIKKNSVSGKEIKESRLGKVPKAKAADTAAKAKAADSATGATFAGSANNAAALGGVPAAGYARGGPPSVIEVGGPGGPAYAGAWDEVGDPIVFWKDPFGMVHIEGGAGFGAKNTVIFTLPAGFRPVGQRVDFSTRTHGCGSPDTNFCRALIRINRNGTVEGNYGVGGSSITLDGISFRAAGG